MATVSYRLLDTTALNRVPATHVRRKQNNTGSSTCNVKHKSTALRTRQLEKVKLCNCFTQLFSGTGFLNKSFPACGGTGSGYNRATNILLHNVVNDAYPGSHPDYARVLISKGALMPAQFAAAVPMKDGNIYFNFTDNSNKRFAAATDKIIVVAYAEALQQVIFSLHAGMRKNCEAILNATSFKGYAVHTWMGFVSKDETTASDSVYTGLVKL